MKYAFITGASRGIGRAIATKLAGEGYHLYLNCLKNKDSLYTLKSELESKYHISCECFVGDISNPEFVKDCFNQITSLSVLINNAGIAHIGLLQDMSIDEWQRIISTNLSASFYTSRQAIPLMLKAGKGNIINISSVWGEVGASMEVAYSAAKGGLNSFTKALAKELAPSNIQVNAISCGVIDTEMNHCFSTEDLDALCSEIPADRFGNPSEVADMVSFTINAPTYMTGQIITLDGGWI